MTGRKLLLLGLLRTQEMHGYHVMEVVESHLGEAVHLTKPTSYRLLSEMAEDGWVSFREEQEGNRPARRVYAVTEKGEVAFQRLLRENLASYQVCDMTPHIGLAFVDELLPREAVGLIERRREAILHSLGASRSHKEHPGSLHLVIDRQVTLLAAELTWLDDVAQRLAAAIDDDGTG